MNYIVTGGIIAAGFTANYFAIGRIKEKSPISANELANLNTADVSGFDRNIRPNW